MTTFLIFLGLIVLGNSQIIYPDQYQYARTPVYTNNQQQLYQSSYYSAPYVAPAAAAVSQSPSYSTFATGAYSAPQAAYAIPVANSLQGSYFAPSTYTVNKPREHQRRQASVNAAAPISPLVETLPSDWAYRVNDIISKGVTKLALNIQNIKYTNNLAERKEKENIIFSPLNLAGALAIVHLGSAGVTFDEVSRILGLDTGVDISTHSELVHQMFGLLMSVVQQGAYGSDRTINIANGLFVQKGYPIRPQFKSINENVYQSEIVNLDFLLKGKEAQERINAWVNEKTNGKISSILNEEPSPATSVIIASALYFNAEWNRHFLKGATRRRPFVIEPNQEIQVDIMYAAGEFPFYEDNNIGVQIVALPYKGLDTTMYVMLPAIEGATALGEFEKTLTPEIIEYLIQNLKNQTTIIAMPKMKITSSLRLKKVLQSLGLISLFDPATADLSLVSPGLGEQNTPVANAAESMNFDSPGKRIDNKESANRDQLIFSRFGETEGEQDTRKNLFQYIDTNRNYNIEQWATGFKIRKLQRKRREIENERIIDKSDVSRVRRQSRVAENFLRTVENKNFRTFGLDNLRNSATLSNPHLFADEVLHKVDITVNERGTEAAAATGVILERDGRQKRLIARRPFLFFIRHNPTKLILFWATINTPTPNFS